MPKKPEIISTVDAVFQMFRFQERIHSNDFYESIRVLDNMNFIKYIGNYTYELTSLGREKLGMKK